MKIAVDTNVLVRVAVRDDARQARLAFRLLKQSPTVIVGLACLCEFVWVLEAVYKFSPTEVATAIRQLLDAANVEMNRPAVEAGLAMLDAGGDFADGIIAAECRWMGGETFVSFDRRAVSKLTAQHYSARLLDAAHSDSRRRTH
jgi:predicted nucleic-acid-binding protein